MPKASNSCLHLRPSASPNYSVAFTPLGETCFDDDNGPPIRAPCVTISRTTYTSCNVHHLKPPVILPTPMGTLTIGLEKLQVKKSRKPSTFFSPIIAKTTLTATNYMNTGALSLKTLSDISDQSDHDPLSKAFSPPSGKTFNSTITSLSMTTDTPPYGGQVFLSSIYITYSTSCGHNVVMSYTRTMDRQELHQLGLRDRPRARLVSDPPPPSMPCQRPPFLRLP